MMTKTKQTARNNDAINNVKIIYNARVFRMFAKRVNDGDMNAAKRCITQFYFTDEAKAEALACVFGRRFKNLDDMLDESARLVEQVEAHRQMLETMQPIS